MALTVTHFPNEKLTFALLFGASEEQERSVLARLRKAGTETAHPMLLPGILAELEHKRQMDVADEMIDELEMQIFKLDSETTTSWKQSGQTTAERNKQKTKAWLDAAFSRNILLATKSLLFSMRRHLDEDTMLVNPTIRRDHHLQHQDADQSAQRGLRPDTPHSSTSSNWQVFSQMSFGSEHSSSETLVAASNPESACDPDAKYQDILQQAGMRMDDRLVSIIGEYDDKIRACTMEVDGMAMATQWVGLPISQRKVHDAKSALTSVPWRNKHGNCHGQRRGLESDAVYRTGHHGIPPRNLLCCEHPISYTPV
jgi:hypothetical protein